LTETGSGGKRDIDGNHMTSHHHNETINGMLSNMIPTTEGGEGNDTKQGGRKG